MLGDIQYFRQSRVFVTAQCRVDDVIGDDARFLGVVTDFAERLFSKRVRLAGAQPNPVLRNILQLDFRSILLAWLAATAGIQCLAMSHPQRS
jgi:hypothetical protein